MARILWHGMKFSASLDQQNPDGAWQATALEHTARTSRGTKIIVQPSEIISIDEVEVLPGGDMAALLKALAEERRTLPHPRELIAAAQEAAKKAKEATDGTL